ncbi:MAG: hypothetical protein ABIG42_07085 [bacterium]
MENEKINKSDETSERHNETNTRTCIGITGISGNNDLAMAKLWISEGMIEKIEIHTVGTDYLITRGENAMRQLSGKTVNEVELYLDYIEPSAPREKPEFDPIFEAVIRALDEYHKPGEESKVDDSTAKPPPVEEVSENSGVATPDNPGSDSGSSPHGA